jgi:hypothetical protein
VEDVSHEFFHLNFHEILMRWIIRKFGNWPDEPNWSYSIKCFAFYWESHPLCGRAHTWMRPYFSDYQLIMCGKLLRNLLCNVSHDGVAKPLEALTLRQARGTNFGLQLIEVQVCGGCVPRIFSP